MTSPQERRRYPRYDAVGLGGRLDGTRPFETLKLGGGGALIQLDDELALEQPVHVALDLDGRTFRSGAVVVFVGPDSIDGRAPTYRIGLSFTDTTRENQEILQAFIETQLARQA